MPVTLRDVLRCSTDTMPSLLRAAALKTGAPSMQVSHEAHTILAVCIMPIVAQLDAVELSMAHGIAPGYGESDGDA